MAAIDKTGAASLIKDFRAATTADPDLYLDRSAAFRRSEEYAKARPVGAHDAHVEKALDHAQAPSDRRRQDSQAFAERLDAIDRGERYTPPAHQDTKHDQHVVEFESFTDPFRDLPQVKEVSTMADITQTRAPGAPGSDVNTPRDADIARRMREKADHDNRARLIKDESRRIEKMQDALRAGGLGAQGSKALREQIDKARQKINAVRAEHEQAEMKRIRERAEQRDREEARASARPQPYVGTDYTGVAKSREAVEGVRSFTSGNDKGAKDAREARNEKHEKAEADADQKASQEARDDIRAAKRAARDAGAGI